jgi:transcriptional regulator with XRE-family HTH domain
MPPAHTDAVAALVVQLLQTERRRRGFSMNAAAERAGLSPQAVSYFERRMRRPTLDSLLMISAALGVDPADVLRRAQECAVRLAAAEGRTRSPLPDALSSHSPVPR